MRQTGLGGGGDLLPRRTARAAIPFSKSRRFTPPTGLMSEQFDRSSGEQSSAKDFAWSYAAFLTCIRARQSRIAGGSTSNPHGQTAWPSKRYLDMKPLYQQQVMQPGAAA
jgi:hypothetical protein